MSNLEYFAVHRNHQLNEEILTPDCKKFLYALHVNFSNTRKQLLKTREDKQKLFDQGLIPGFPIETKQIRESKWQAAPYPKQLDRRWLEITGPANHKTCINAMNSKSDVFMADFEDALAPTWKNIITGQKALIDANNRSISFTENNKLYKFRSGELATLIVRPRGWHLEEWNVSCQGEAFSASIFDFGVYFFHNYKIRMEKFGGVFYYLPKMEAYQEARLWEDIFHFSEKYFNVPVGTIRCTILIETLLGGLEMEEMIYELKNHITACNAGRWDYIFSAIKKLKNFKDAVLPDRTEITMTVPFMRAYTERLVQVCHKRGIHAIGGMAAFIPAKGDSANNEMVIQKIIQDKTREFNDGFDGSWIAHPDNVDVARQVFETKLQGRDHQKNKLREDVNVSSDQMVNLKIDKPITENGVRNNINVCLIYMYNWVSGRAAVNIHNLMEDAATAEIARGQLWQWIKNKSCTNNSIVITKECYLKFRDEEIIKFNSQLKNKVVLAKAIEITDALVLSDKFYDFLTSYSYHTLLNFEQYPSF